jgi:glutamine synthetase adenylyltransferase
VLDPDQSAFPYRFQRTDLWKPVYQWLETLEMETLVESKQISDWLAANPQVMNRLVEKHSKYHLIHYSQRMHLKLLKKRGKLPKVQFFDCGINDFILSSSVAFARNDFR